jgi:hypothetical protein
VLPRKIASYRNLSYIARFYLKKKKKKKRKRRRRRTKKNA